LLPTALLCRAAAPQAKKQLQPRVAAASARVAAVQEGNIVLARR
jgi:hypothetical protein